MEDVNGLILETKDGERVHLEPQGVDEKGRPVVELYAWPTLIRVRLRAKADDQWEIETDMGVPFRQPWNRETLINVVSDLLTTK